jgi:hypothetical protein
VNVPGEAWLSGIICTLRQGWFHGPIDANLAYSRLYDFKKRNAFLVRFRLKDFNSLLIVTLVEELPVLSPFHIALTVLTPPWKNTNIPLPISTHY